MVLSIHKVEFTREAEEEGLKTLKHNKRILFQRMAPYPQRKVITFNRYNADFAFDINYGDLSFLSQDEIRLDSGLFFFSACWSSWKVFCAEIKSLEQCYWHPWTVSVLELVKHIA